MLEGLDGCGKTTQLERLKRYFTENSVSFRQIKLPDYGSDSSILVRHYLSGDYGKKADDVNAYAASVLFAADRFASFKTDWEKDYISGKLILADRYTTSNAALQCCKLRREMWDGFLDWLYDFEFCKIGIPKPDRVIFLDMKPEISQRLLSGRYSGHEEKKDIHEKDVEYLKRCREASLYSADRLGWKVIRCDDGENVKSIDDIFSEVLNKINDIITGEK